MSFIILIIFVSVIIFLLNKLGDDRAIKNAGNQGERAVTNAICSILRDGDALFNNVELTHEGKRTELDNVVVNRNGVFIVEVKNYSGELVGDENDSEWTKYHVSSGRNVYEKKVRNPIPQVKRQIYILSGLLRSKRLKAWVDGYVVFVNNNSPVYSNYVLESIDAMDRTFHKQPKRYLTNAEVQSICNLLGTLGTRRY